MPLKIQVFKIPLKYLPFSKPRTPPPRTDAPYTEKIIVSKLIFDSFRYVTDKESNNDFLQGLTFFCCAQKKDIIEGKGD